MSTANGAEGYSGDLAKIKAELGLPEDVSSDVLPHAAFYNDRTELLEEGGTLSNVVHDTQRAAMVAAAQECLAEGKTAEDNREVKDSVRTILAGVLGEFATKAIDAGHVPFAGILMERMQAL